MRRWIFVALGAACVLPLVAVDPAAAMLLVDIEFLVALGSAGSMILHGDARTVWHQFLDRPSMLIFRAGIGLTRESPRSLLNA